jgi:probable F420-dependent oxidoreductase
VGIRFGYQLGRQDLADPLGAARQAEAAGFDVVLASDHVGPGRSPLPMLAAIAACTERIRIGTFVLNNDMRNPVQLAWEATTLDHLSGGRFELGLGAGHTPREYAATSIGFDPPGVRKRRLMESVEVIRALLDGEEVTRAGEFFQVEAARIERSVQARLPILVGGNGPALLQHAGLHADVVGLQGLGRTLPDGHRHTVDFTPDRLTAQVAQVRAAAGERAASVELNALVQVAEVTADRDPVLGELVASVDGLTREDAEDVPYVLVGTVDEIVAKVSRCRDRWGITYFVVRTLEPFAPVIAALS